MRVFQGKISLLEGAQVQIVQAEIVSMDASLGLVSKILNNSEKEIEYLKMEALFQNSMGKFLFDRTVFSKEYGELALAHGTIDFLPPWQLDERHGTARSVQVRISEIHFADGSRKYMDLKKEHLYKLPIVPDEKREKMQTLYGSDVMTYGENFPRSWRCVCGFINGDVDTCSYCSRNREFVTKTLNERAINKKFYNMAKGSGEEAVDLKLVQRHDTMTIKHIDDVAVPKVAPPRHLPSPSAIVTLLALILTVTSVYFLGSYLYQRYTNTQKLHRAEAMTALGRYEEAYAIYQKLPTKMDNVDITLRMEELHNLARSNALYEEGLLKIKEDDPLAAVDLFLQVKEDNQEDYLDAQAMIRALRKDLLREIQTLLDEGKEEEARVLVGEFLLRFPEDEGAMRLRERLPN
ncbi:MAG: hypothetical protein Q4E76_02490 [Tissierellia bacterium]|nr:hypothetical protein [Tissierellia bacterium]